MEQIGSAYAQPCGVGRNSVRVAVIRCLCQRCPTASMDGQFDLEARLEEGYSRDWRTGEGRERREEKKRERDDGERIEENN